MDERTRLKAREYLLKTKLYRFITIAFLLIGVILFIFLYLTHVEGNVMDALRRPVTVLIFLVPFLPAAFLSFLTRKTEKKLFSILNTDNPEDDKTHSDAKR